MERAHEQAGKSLERNERAVILSVAFPVSLAEAVIAQAHREGVSPSVVVCRTLETSFALGDDAEEQNRWLTTT